MEELYIYNKQVLPVDIVYFKDNIASSSGNVLMDFSMEDVVFQNSTIYMSSSPNSTETVGISSTNCSITS